MPDWSGDSRVQPIFSESITIVLIPGHFDWPDSPLQGQRDIAWAPATGRNCENWWMRAVSGRCRIKH